MAKNLNAIEAPRLLEVWLQESGVTQAVLADAIGVSEPTLTEYVKRRRCPRDLTRQKIRRATCGAVPIDAWDSAEERADVRRVRRLGASR